MDKNQPGYRYTSIEMRKSSDKKIWWLIFLFILVIGFIFLIPKNNQKNPSLSVTSTPTPESNSGLKEYKNNAYNWSIKYDASNFYPYEPGKKEDPVAIWFYKKKTNDVFYCVNNFAVEVLSDNQTKKIIDNPEKLTISGWIKQREAKNGTLFPEFSKRELTKVDGYEAMKFINDTYKAVSTRINDPFRPIIYLVAVEDKIFFLSYNISTDKETKEICNGNEEAMDKVFQTFSHMK